MDVINWFGPIAGCARVSRDRGDKSQLVSAGGRPTGRSSAANQGARRPGRASEQGGGGVHMSGTVGKRRGARLRSRDECVADGLALATWPAGSGSAWRGREPGACPDGLTGLAGWLAGCGAEAWPRVARHVLRGVALRAGRVAALPPAAANRRPHPGEAGRRRHAWPRPCAVRGELTERCACRHPPAACPAAGMRPSSCIAHHPLPIANHPPPHRPPPAAQRVPPSAARGTHPPPHGASVCGALRSIASGVKDGLRS